MNWLFLLSFLLMSIGALGEVSSESLSKETLVRFERVPEFAFIIQEAEKLGVKVYLFGGTASAFSHYVRWDLEREAGDTKYQDERFDYDFTNIYRGNQDLDIVVDGATDQAQALRQILQKTYPHFMGEREAWEVRLLKATMGDKHPLLDDYDFKNQHTDTNSTGMLALNPAEGEIVYRDLLDWENPQSEFLTDVAAAKIKFLYNDKHETTSRFKEGKNPPILAAIRYLAKLTQYEVEGTPQDLEVVKKIISQTEAKEFTPYVKKKAFEFGLKAFLNAPDVEYAWNLLDETGARKLLMEIDGNQFASQDTLSWWFNKEPLRSSKLGAGEGKTAREVFGADEIILAHETNSFIAYENITRSAKGRANVFISREKIVGEAAHHGDGFYTQIGKEGARGTGLTVRFKLDPEAREGVDFIKSGNFIIIKNKNSLELVQEKINISILEYIKLTVQNQITSKDKGLKEKILRRISRLGDQKDYLETYTYILEEEDFHMQKSFSYHFLMIILKNMETMNLQLEQVLILFNHIQSVEEISADILFELAQEYINQKDSEEIRAIIEEFLKERDKSLSNPALYFLLNFKESEQFPALKKAFLETAFTDYTSQEDIAVEINLLTLKHLNKKGFIESYVQNKEVKNLQSALQRMIVKRKLDKESFKVLLVYAENILPDHGLMSGLLATFKDLTGLYGVMEINDPRIERIIKLILSRGNDFFNLYMTSLIHKPFILLDYVQELLYKGIKEKTFTKNIINEGMYARDHIPKKIFIDFEEYLFENNFELSAFNYIRIFERSVKDEFKEKRLKMIFSRLFNQRELTHENGELYSHIINVQITNWNVMFYILTNQLSALEKSQLNENQKIKILLMMIQAPELNFKMKILDFVRNNIKGKAVVQVLEKLIFILSEKENEQVDETLMGKLSNWAKGKSSLEKDLEKVLKEERALISEIDFTKYNNEQKRALKRFFKRYGLEKEVNWSSKKAPVGYQCGELLNE